MADSRPVSVGQIDMAEGKCPGDKRAIIRVKLPFHPIGPDPVEIVLDGFGVDQPSGVEGYSGSNQLNRFLNFRGLGKLADAGKKR